MLQEQGDAEGSRAAFQRAIDSGNPDQAPIAAFDLALLRDEQGDAEGARAAYQLAIDSGHQGYAPVAEVVLSDLDR